MTMLLACGGDDAGQSSSGTEGTPTSAGMTGSSSGASSGLAGTVSTSTQGGSSGADTTEGGDDTEGTGPAPAGRGSIEFFGNGGLYGDRVLIELDDPATTEPGPPIDVGGTDFTIELWIRPDPAANDNPAIACGGTNDWVTSNIIVDRDRHSQAPSFGIGIAGGVIVWAVQGEAGDPWSMCGTTDVLDGDWHHIAVQRRRSDGYLWLFVDGQLDADVDGPDGDVSYPDDGQPMDVCPGGACDYSDPFLAIGAEKHGYEGISYTGLVDELRLSSTLRHDGGGYEPPSTPYVADDATVGLFHFDDGSGSVASDASPNGSDGTLVLGGDPEGPVWSQADPWG